MWPAEQAPRLPVSRNPPLDRLFQMKWTLRSSKLGQKMLIIKKVLELLRKHWIEKLRTQCDMETEVQVSQEVRFLQIHLCVGVRVHRWFPKSCYS